MPDSITSGIQPQQQSQHEQETYSAVPSQRNRGHCIRAKDRFADGEASPLLPESSSTIRIGGDVLRRRFGAGQSARTSSPLSPSAVADVGARTPTQANATAVTDHAALKRNIHTNSDDAICHGIHANMKNNTQHCSSRRNSRSSSRARSLSAANHRPTSPPASMTALPSHPLMRACTFATQSAASSLNTCRTTCKSDTYRRRSPPANSNCLYPCSAPLTRRAPRAQSGISAGTNPTAQSVPADSSAPYAAVDVAQPSPSHCANVFTVHIDHDDGGAEMRAACTRLCAAVRMRNTYRCIEEGQLDGVADVDVTQAMSHNTHPVMRASPASSTMGERCCGRDARMRRSQITRMAAMGNARCNALPSMQPATGPTAEPFGPVRRTGTCATVTTAATATMARLSWVDGVVVFDGLPISVVPWEQYYDDLLALIECTQAPSCQAACLCRLQVLEEKFNIFKVYNGEAAEQAEWVERSHRVATVDGAGGSGHGMTIGMHAPAPTAVVDNHVELSRMMSARSVVRYVRYKMRYGGHEVALNAANSEPRGTAAAAAAAAEPTSNTFSTQTFAPNLVAARRSVPQADSANPTSTAQDGPRCRRAATPVSSSRFGDIDGSITRQAYTLDEVCAALDMAGAAHHVDADSLGLRPSPERPLCGYDILDPRLNRGGPQSAALLRLFLTRHGYNDGTYLTDLVRASLQQRQRQDEDEDEEEEDEEDEEEDCHYRGGNSCVVQPERDRVAWEGAHPPGGLAPRRDATTEGDERASLRSLTTATSTDNGKDAMDSVASADIIDTTATTNTSASNSSKRSRDSRNTSSPAAAMTASGMYPLRPRRRRCYCGQEVVIELTGQRIDEWLSLARWVSRLGLSDEAMNGIRWIIALRPPHRHRAASSSSSSSSSSVPHPSTSSATSSNFTSSATSLPLTPDMTVSSSTFPVLMRTPSAPCEAPVHSPETRFSPRVAHTSTPNKLGDYTSSTSRNTNTTRAANHSCNALLHTLMNPTISSSSLCVDNYQQLLNNIFTPLFRATLHPHLRPDDEVAKLLTHIGGFVLFLDEDADDGGIGSMPRIRRRPGDVSAREKVSGFYLLYYIWANLYTLNALRQRQHGRNGNRGSSTNSTTSTHNSSHCTPLQLRLCAGSDGSTAGSSSSNGVHLMLAAGYLLCDVLVSSSRNGTTSGTRGSGAAAFGLSSEPVLQFLYGMHGIGVTMSPMHDNALGQVNYMDHPFPRLLRCGVRVSLSTVRPLISNHAESALAEEYNMARSMYKLSRVDVREVALNSVCMSSLDDETKAEWLGDLAMVRGRVPCWGVSGVMPWARWQLRQDMWYAEWELLRRSCAYMRAKERGSAAAGSAAAPWPNDMSGEFHSRVSCTAGKKRIMIDNPIRTMKGDTTCDCRAAGCCFSDDVVNGVLHSPPRRERHNCTNCTRLPTPRTNICHAMGRLSPLSDRSLRSTEENAPHNRATEDDDAVCEEGDYLYENTENNDKDSSCDYSSYPANSSGHRNRGSKANTAEAARGAEGGLPVLPRWMTAAVGRHAERLRRRPPYEVVDPHTTFSRVLLVGPYGHARRHSAVAQRLRRALSLREHYTTSRHTCDSVPGKEMRYVGHIETAQGETTTIEAAADANGDALLAGMARPVCAPPVASTPLREREWSFKTIEGVMVWHEVHQIPQLPQGMCRYENFRQHVQELRSIANDLQVRSFAERRLRLLEHRFSLHLAINRDCVGEIDDEVWDGDGGKHEALQHDEQPYPSRSTVPNHTEPYRNHSAYHSGLGSFAHNSPLYASNDLASVSALPASMNHDFYQSTKVDNNVRIETGMTARRLLDFIIAKARNSGDDIVSHPHNKEPQTLRQLLRELHISPDSLTVDQLHVQRVDSTWGRGGAGSTAQYTPEGRDALLTLLLKTNNQMGGRYFAELTKITFENLKSDRFTFTESRLPIYGADREEWGWLSTWFDTYGMASVHNSWMIQIPRIYSHLRRRGGRVRHFADYLENIFAPLWAVSLHPNKEPRLFHFVNHITGFDCVGEEAVADVPLLTATPPAPHAWTSEEEPPYNYYLYYIWANIYTLNAFRGQRGFSRFTFRPSCGEQGGVEHLIGGFLLARGINYGLQLRHEPVLQYLFYLAHIGITMSPLSNNTKTLPYLDNPFPLFFRRGLPVSLGTESPLIYHHTQEPLLEEYSIASKIWKLSANDLCEIARNSVRLSGFSDAFKASHLGRCYFLSSSASNDAARTHLSDTRVAYRFETYHNEVGFLEYVAGQAFPRAMHTLQEEEEDLLARRMSGREPRQIQPSQKSQRDGFATGELADVGNAGFAAVTAPPPLCIIDADSDSAELTRLDRQGAQMRTQLARLHDTLAELQRQNRQLSERLAEEQRRDARAMAAE